MSALLDDFEKELEKLVNSYSLENGPDMPDYAIAAYLRRAYESLCVASDSKVNWRTPPIMPCLCHVKSPDGMGLACSIEGHEK